MANNCLSVVLHGGAGVDPKYDYTREVEHMRGLVEAARDRLEAGGTALDVCVETIRSLELSGMYVAGRGSSPNTAGRYELDASLMDGCTGDAGAVAAFEGFQCTIEAARAVMEATPHVMLAGAGAAAFATARGLARIEDMETWFTKAGSTEKNLPPGGTAALAHGTVGCVVRDAEGRLAAGTSTGGVFGKLPGRVGDTPIIGAGCWADKQVAISCTGQGEYFIRTAAAAQVAHRMKFGGESLKKATQAVIDEIAALGGDGGLIAVAADGSVAMPYSSPGMKRAALTPDGKIIAASMAL